MEKILLVEDSEGLRDALRVIMSAEGFQVEVRSSAEEALGAIQKSMPALVISDLKLPQKSGIDLLREARAAGCSAPFIIMTAFGTVEIAVQAMIEGAANFLVKPFESRDLVGLVRTMLAPEGEEGRANRARTETEEMFVTKNSHTQSILRQARKAAPVDTSVLISGESGTGKEVLARLIHRNSARKGGPFVAVNCAAIQPGLVESEFFGHEPGAFTGANQARVGLLEAASEGTIFLDELAEMPLSLQVKLLRALQEREIRRLGGNKTIKINPRVIAATNRDLEEALSQGALREDLYYRVAVVSFRIPPLRERREDIPALVEHYLSVYGERNKKLGLRIDDAALNVMRRYSWPGNARELENTVERAVILASDVIRPEHLGLDLSLDLDALSDASETLPKVAEAAAREAEIRFISRALRDTAGNKVKAAQILGVSYKTLLSKVKEYNLGSSSEEGRA